MSDLQFLSDAKRVLQIIHVSDMHVLAARHPTASHILKAIRNAKKISTTLYKILRDGTAPSDPFAPVVFQRFIKKVAIKDPDWSGVETWIIDTGDHSIFGDRASLIRAQQYLAGFASVGGPSGHINSVTNVHGNHDAWPDNLPLFARSNISQHTTMLGQAPFSYAVQTAQAPIQTPLPVKGAEIQLYTIDTVNDGYWRNTWARGIVKKPQLSGLYKLIQKQQGAPGACHLRILATHHPIHYPPPRPNYAMVVAGSKFIGKHLSDPQNYIHLVLSGHTHALYPEHGKLPTSPRACDHDPLDNDQCQLVVGSLMQVDRFAKRWPHAHQCQVLRFYQDPSEPRIVILKRLLAARDPSTTSPQRTTGGIGEYKFIKLPGRESYEEEMTINL
jgi:hypothetical protein